MAIDIRSADPLVHSSLRPPPESSNPDDIQSSLPSTLMWEPSFKDPYRNTSSDDVSATQASQHSRTPHTFYPLRYGRKLRDMEVWDNTFVQIASGRPTFTPSEYIPTDPVMLDLGCGYGHWPIIAARYFPGSLISGLDIADIQPDLRSLGFQDIADRITWVHADMLERLPFPDDYFDLVRSLHIEFCVPETKWGKLLEELRRILKPGGIFEMAQEALTFPCPRFPPRKSPRRDARAMRAEGDEGRPGRSTELADEDPRDHSRLKAAFDAMLEVRFLNPQIISTLPFYMDLQFENVHMTPTFHVMLPPSSFVRDQEDICQGAAAEPQLLADQRISVPEMLNMEQHASNLEVTSEGGQMHLNQTMNIILSCKEAMWEQFQILYSTLERADFDFLMKNWEMDMRDRIDMRGMLEAGLSWGVPAGDDDPDQKRWREETLKFHLEDGVWDALPIPEPCRVIRAFTGTKLRKNPTR